MVPEDTSGTSAPAPVTRRWRSFGKLIKLKTTKSPFPAKVKDEAVTTWVRPLLVAEVKFAEWTSKGDLRQPVYLGLRADKRQKTSYGKGHGRENDAEAIWRPAIQPAARSDAVGHGGKGGKPRALRTGPNDRRCAAHAPSLSSAA
jgi:hypothetical protein